MAINSVSSATSAVQQQKPVMAKEPQQPPVERPREKSEAMAASAPQPPAQQSAPPQRAERPERAEQPKPVVNAQGQKTGTIISTTA